MSESSDSDYDLFKKHGYESDPEDSQLLRDKENEVSGVSLASQVAGPSHAKEDSNDTRHSANQPDEVKEAGPSRAGVSFKDDRRSKTDDHFHIRSFSKEAGPSHVHDAKRLTGTGRYSVSFRDSELSQTYKSSKDDKENDERKEKSHARDDTVLTIDESNPEIKEFLARPKSASSTSRRNSSLTYNAYLKRLDSSYQSELFESIVHHFRRSVTSAEVSVPSEVTSLSSVVASQMSFPGQRKKSSLYSEIERRNSVKKSLRSSVFLNAEIGLVTDVTYNDFNGRIWIMVISVALWALTLISYFMRIYSMSNTPVTLEKVPSFLE